MSAGSEWDPVRAAATHVNETADPDS